MTPAPAEPDVCPAILNRRSSRSFSSRPVGDEALARLFEAARWAPSAGNGQPWRFVVTRHGNAQFERLTGALRASNAWAARAPVLVLTTARMHHVHPTKPPKANRLALFELGLSVGNLITQATAMGIVAHPLGGFDAATVRDALRVPPEFETAVLVAIGYPEEFEGPENAERVRDDEPRGRMPTHEIVFHQTWGVAADDRQGADVAGSNEPIAGRDHG